MTLNKFRKFGFYSNAGALPVIGNAIHKKNDTNRLVLNSMIQHAVFSFGAVILFDKLKNHLPFANKLSLPDKLPLSDKLPAVVIAAALLFSALLVVQGAEYGYLKYQEDNKAAEKSAADTGAIVGILTLGVLPLISWLVDKISEKTSCAHSNKFVVSEVQGVSNVVGVSA